MKCHWVKETIYGKNVAQRRAKFHMLVQWTKQMYFKLTFVTHFWYYVT